MTAPKYLWLDLETTGLNPEHDRILECAALITDGDLFVTDTGLERELPVNGEDLARMNDYVRNMHTENGLLEAVRCLVVTGGKSPAEALADLEADLCDMIDGIAWADGKPILAGATVHFDRGFLRRWCPTFEARLHHRHLDVSSLKMMVVDRTGEPFAKAEAHRAMADVVESLEQAREIYERWGGG